MCFQKTKICLFINCRFNDNKEEGSTYSLKTRGKQSFFVFILDTSCVTDPRYRKEFSTDSLNDVIIKLTQLISKLKLSLGVSFFVTNSIAKEMKNYMLANGVEESTINEFFMWVTVKMPEKLSIKIPAVIFSEYLKEMRMREIKALKISEDFIKKAYDLNYDEKNISELIHDLREKFREAMRKGIIDSPEDFDAVLLSYELKGVLVTNDEGMRKVSEIMGVITIDPLAFLENLRRLMIYLNNEEKT
ncbi:MAG: RNA ligase partner protein [Fervidicoccus sp.]